MSGLRPIRDLYLSENHDDRAQAEELLVALGRRAPRLWVLERHLRSVSKGWDSSENRAWQLGSGFGWKVSDGLFVLSLSRNESYGVNYNLHLLPRRECWTSWGAYESWYDGPLYGFLLGPILQVHIGWPEGWMNQFCSWLVKRLPQAKEW